MSARLGPNRLSPTLALAASFQIGLCSRTTVLLKRIWDNFIGRSIDQSIESDKSRVPVHAMRNRKFTAGRIHVFTERLFRRLSSFD